jgi:hypothetical protein
MLPFWIILKVNNILEHLFDRAIEHRTSLDSWHNQTSLSCIDIKWAPVITSLHFIDNFKDYYLVPIRVQGYSSQRYR